MTYDPNRPTTPEPSWTPTDATSSTPTPVAPVPPVPTAPVFAPPPVMAAPAPLPVAKSKSSSGRLVNVILAIAVAVAIGGVAFAVGRTTAPAAAATTGRNGFGNGGFPNGSFTPNASGVPGFGGGGRGFGGGGLTVRGTVESVSGDTVTIKTANGQTIEVSTGADTTYNTQAPGTASDVTEGKTVEVQLSGVTGGGFRPGASAAPSGAVGTAGSITVIP